MILPKELLNSPFQLIPACLNIVKGVLSGLETGKVKLKIPRPGDERKKTKNSHFHLTPEVFFQISGVVPSSHLCFLMPFLLSLLIKYYFSQ